MQHQRLPPKRPWYVLDRLADEYKRVLRNGGNFRMLRTLKIVRSIIVNLGIIGVTIVALLQTDVDATLVATVAVLTLGLYNGVDIADYAALAQAFAEVDLSDETVNDSEESDHDRRS